ncbi:MAG TPA: glycoside hydrolase domain-containing protein [Polyangiaceae bacterium]
MSSAPWVSFLALSLAFAAPACRKEPAVQVLGDSTRLHADEPSPSESAFFDGKVVSLFAARGETLGLSLRVRDGRERHVVLELPEGVARVTGFDVRSLEVKEPSTEMYGPSRGVGRYPDVLVPSRTPALRVGELGFFDVEVLRAAKPGRYEGRLTVDERRIPVVLDVAEASIDLGEDLLVWVFYLPKEVARAHFLADGESPELIEKERAYHELFRRHGAYLAATLPPTRFEARRQFMKNVRYWPVALDLASDASIERDVRAWLEHFRDSDVTPFTIPVDEPHTDEARARARHIAEVIGRAGGGRPRLLRGVTDAPRPSYGDVFDVYFSPNGFTGPQTERRARGERFWTYNGKPPGAGSMVLDGDGVGLRTWGWIAERYDIELWYAWEGLYFTDRYNRGGPTDVMVDPVTFDERSRGQSDFGNGDGLLAYPGPLPSLRLKTLRRGLQDRLLLRALERCAGVEPARRIVERNVPKALGEARGKPSWALEETSWESARREVLRQIEVSCHEDDLVR